MTDKDSLPQKNIEPQSGMNRREVLLAMGVVATAAYTGSAAAAMPGHDHSKHKPQHSAVLDATNACTETGQLCGTFSDLLAANSEYSKAYANICISACEDCEKVCREHDEHFECKDCADACAALVKAIKTSMA